MLLIPVDIVVVKLAGIVLLMHKSSNVQNVGAPLMMLDP
jgi:hypothetical protein